MQTSLTAVQHQAARQTQQATEHRHRLRLLHSDHDNLSSEHSRLYTDHLALLGKFDALRRAHDGLTVQHDVTAAELKHMSTKHERLWQEHKDLFDKVLGSQQTLARRSVDQAPDEVL